MEEAGVILAPEEILEEVDVDLSGEEESCVEDREPRPELSP